MTADLKIQAAIELVGFEITIYSHSFPLDEDWAIGGFDPFLQSLTWGEPIHRMTECDHIVSRVPVALWYDHSKKMPVRNWPAPVRPTENVRVDANVRHLTSAIPDENGKLSIYLPNGTYILTTVSGDRKATSEEFSILSWKQIQPVDMVIGSTAERKFTVKKEWDIDIEDHDRPASIQVLLQRSTYNDVSGIFAQLFSSPGSAWQGVQIVELKPDNQWSAEFNPVPVYEFDADGNRREIKYRVRELRQPTEEEYPDINNVEKAGKRAVLDRWDLDNTHLWEKLKDKVTDFNTYWQITPT